MDSGRQISLKGKNKGKVQAKRSSRRTILTSTPYPTPTPTLTGTHQSNVLSASSATQVQDVQSDVGMGGSDWEEPSSPTHGGSFPSSDTDFDNFEVDDGGAEQAVAPNSAEYVGASQVTVIKPPKRFRPDPFQQWKQHRLSSLQRLFVNEGLGVADGEPLLCIGCSSDLLRDPSSAPLRCKTCWLSPTFCKACLCRHHQRAPFHHVESWNGSHWIKDSLGRQGLKIHLRHCGSQCPSPGSCRELYFLHVNGYHKLPVQFCDCDGDEEEQREFYQLLDAELFPASFVTPQTVFTFEVLDTLLVMSNVGRMSTYDFYQSLRTLSDNCELHGWPKRYSELASVTRRYRDILLMKRMAVAHSHDMNIRPGSLAVECPACPHPGKNLPTDWEIIFRDKSYLHAQYIGVDANFRHKQKERGFDDDMGLVSGGAYFVDAPLFSQELHRINEENDVRLSGKRGGRNTAGSDPTPDARVSTCESSFAAIERADSRLNRGYAVTGVVAAIDSRHGLVLPNAVADLQRGERYFNSDFVFLSALRERGLTLVYLSYDIACRWGVSLQDRIHLFPEELRHHTESLTIILAIPKFHLPAHGSTCWSRFSFNYLIGSARTDGEAVERFWSSSNPVASSTREMAPGSRHDFLEDRWGSSNHRKVVELGPSLARKLATAVNGNRKHSAEAAELTNAINPNIIAKWTKMVEDWSRDPNQHPDPYQIHTQDFTIADIEKELRGEEVAASQASDSAAIQAFHPAEVDFLIAGLHLELDQRRLKEESLKRGQSLTNELTIERRREGLGVRITAWLGQQAVLMPRVTAYRASEPFTGIEESPGRRLASTDADPHDRPSFEDSAAYPLGMKAEHVPLYLPSSPVTIVHDFATPTLRQRELRLRLGRLAAHLSELRRLLRIKTSVYLFKKGNLVGQRAGTRSTTLLANYSRKIDGVAQDYREERAAALRLDPSGVWVAHWKDLKKEDVRAAHQNEDEVSRPEHPRPTNQVWNEAQRTISWIWKVPQTVRIHEDSSSLSTSENEHNPSVSATEEEVALQVEWAKASARAARFREEEDLVIEEMKRVRRWFAWRRAWWVEKSHGGSLTASPHVKRGRVAYACKQIGLIDALRAKFTNMWLIELGCLSLDAKLIDIQ